MCTNKIAVIGDQQTTTALKQKLANAKNVITPCDLNPNPNEEFKYFVLVGKQNTSEIPLLNENYKSIYGACKNNFCNLGQSVYVELFVHKLHANETDKFPERMAELK